jgi:transcriptional regulator with XRE-family HTH domain
MSIRPEQCRAARALLGLSQEELARAAGISRATLIDFERGEREPIFANLKMIQAALERAGIEFTAAPDNRIGVLGPKSKNRSSVTTRTKPRSRSG